MYLFLEIGILEAPPHAIRIRELVNDTPIPGHIQFDEKTGEASFDWHGMLCEFFREQKELNKRDAIRVCKKRREEREWKK